MCGHLGAGQPRGNDISREPRRQVSSKGKGRTAPLSLRRAWEREAGHATGLPRRDSDDASPAVASSQASVSVCSWYSYALIARPTVLFQARSATGVFPIALAIARTCAWMLPQHEPM